MEGGSHDSNSIMLPGKKPKEKQIKKQISDEVKAESKAKLSKSQKRKLKRLEEEKDRVTHLCQSIDTLEKCKLKDEVHSLLWSAKNMGKVETAREKRLREFHCYKAGVKIPLTKKRAIDHFAHEVEQFTDKVGINTQERREVPNNNDGVDDDKKVDCGSTIVLVNSPPGKPLGSSSTIETDIAETCLDSSKQERNVVPVYRPAEVESQRENLPIVMMEQEIMEKINQYTSVIICGETGCGKTTQVPQFLYEAAYGSKHSRTRSGLIGVTQPRRLAVLSTAKRVAYELGLHLGKEVGFQVRHDKMIGDDCSIKFMTDGILLREIQNDFLLKRYSIIILDEAHERSLNTDILIGMLSRIIIERQRQYLEQKEIEESINPQNRIYPLKLVLMSATLRVEDFVSNRRIFYDPPPVIDVPTRQYPVTVHFAKITDEVDYVGQAYKKVLLIHKRLPPGGILVFLTGQREVKYLCQKLRKASKAMMIEKNYPPSYNNHINSASGDSPRTEELNDKKDINEAFESQGSSSNCEITDCFSSDDDLSDNESESNEDSYLDEDLSNQEPMESTVLQNKDGCESSQKAAFEALAGKRSFEHGSQGKEVSNFGGAGPMRVLPLYAMLPASEQLSVFEQVKEGERLVVVATNVAETSLTIPGIKYVVDSGREKVRKYNSSNGTEEYKIEYISQASAAQRAGRSGRTGPGHCYRLYSSAAFTNVFPPFSTAEILKVPVDGVVLLIKSMHIDKVANFPFPTPPEATAIAEAECCLKVLGALDSQGRLTTLGETMARYPTSPRHSRMLLTVILIVSRNVQRNKSAIRPNLVLAHAVAAAAALSLPNPFTHGKDAGNEEAGEKMRKEKPKEIKFCNPDSDALTTAFALQCFELSTCPADEFCSDNGLHLKTLKEMSKLRRQLLQLIFSSKDPSEFVWTHGGNDDVEHAWRVPSHPLSESEEKIIRKAICAGWADRVAKRFTTKGTTNSGLLSVDGDRKVDAVRYQACSVVNETVFLDRCSSLSRCTPKFLVYSELLRTKKRTYIRGATKVEAAWIVEYAPSMCTFSSPHPVYDSETDQVCRQAIPSFGPHLWQLAHVRHNLPMEDGEKRVAVFAAALLEGRVLPCMSSKSCFLAEKAATILRRPGVKRAGNLLHKLSSKGIDSRSRLKKLWEDDWRELFFEIRDWYQQRFHDGFEELWGEMQHEILSLAPRNP